MASLSTASTLNNAKTAAMLTNTVLQCMKPCVRKLKDKRVGHSGIKWRESDREAAVNDPSMWWNLQGGHFHIQTSSLKSQFGTVNMKSS